jgi:hypothetical protein
LKVLDQLVVTPNWRKAMARIGASEGLAFVWRAQAIKARKDGDTSTPLFLEWRGTYDYWDAHASRARVENVIIFESAIRDQALNGIEHVVLGPDQRPVYKENPAYIGRDDEYVMLSEGCAPGEVARYRLQLDAKGNPVPLTKIEQLPAPLRLRVLEQDRRYVERKEHDVQHSGEIQVTKPMTRLPGEQRPDVARLRQLAAMPPEQRRAEFGASAVPLDACGNRTIATATLPPEPKEAAPRPSYARPSQPLDGAGTGRGTVPDGGMKMV